MKNLLVSKILISPYTDWHHSEELWQSDQSQPQHTLCMHKALTALRIFKTQTGTMCALLCLRLCELVWGSLNPRFTNGYSDKSAAIYSCWFQSCSFAGFFFLCNMLVTGSNGWILTASRITTPFFLAIFQFAINIIQLIKQKWYLKLTILLPSIHLRSVYEQYPCTDKPQPKMNWTATVDSINQLLYLVLPASNFYSEKLYQSLPFLTALLPWYVIDMIFSELKWLT